MDQRDVADSDSNELKMPGQTSESMGALAAMKSIRQSRGMTLEDVSARLKFAPKQIEAFEQGRWEEFQNGIGLRTLAKNYCRLLGVDLSSIEDLLPAQETRSGSVLARQHHSGSLVTSAAEQVGSKRSWPWVMLILLAVLLVFGFAVWQDIVPQTLLPEWLKGMFE